MNTAHRIRFAAVLTSMATLSGCWGFSPKQQTYQTAAAIEAGISNNFNNEVKTIGGLTGKWTILTDQQYDALIKRISARKFLPGPKGWKPGEVLTDYWGHRFHVAMKRDDLVVWSNGPDGKENTPDDIISPHTFHGKLPEE